jgi:hypothetical protein
MVMEESDLDLFGSCHYNSLGATSRISVIVIFLLITSCAYHTEIRCPSGLTMKQVDEKCNFIQHGSTSKWVLKKKK